MSCAHMNPREACASCAPTKYKALLIAFDARGQRIEAALALHVEIEGQWKAKVCRECSGMYSVAYPCPTVKALRGEEGVE